MHSGLIENKPQTVVLMQVFELFGSGIVLGTKHITHVGQAHVPPIYFVFVIVGVCMYTWGCG